MTTESLGGRELAYIRRSEQAAADVLEELVPRAVLVPVLQAMVASIARAHRAQPDKWGLRVNAASVMLKVGKIEVLEVRPDIVHFVVLSSQVPPALRRAEARAFSGKGSGYISVPGSEYCDMPAAGAARNWSRLAEAHLRLVDAAAETPRRTTTVRTHSPGAVAYLARRLGTFVPQPRYAGLIQPVGGGLAEEVAEGEEFEEGAVTQVLINRYERDPAARAACIAHHGHRCAACGRAMEDVYGAIGKGIIHVHHLRPLSEVRGRRAVDPVRDLRPVCPNCHAVLHGVRPARPIEELARLFGTGGP